MPLLLPGTAFASPQAAASESTDTYTIRGIVVNSVTHAAVARALVFSNDSRFAKLTDGDGRFVLKINRPAPQPNAPNAANGARSAGIAQSQVFTSIFLSARKPGFFDASGQQLWFNGDSDDPPEVQLSLTPEALIIGRVNLPSNDGTDKIQVQVYQRKVQEGRAHWIPAGSVTSRANGDFRFANLSEGDYKLFTRELTDNDPLTLDPRGPRFGYPPAYFPNSSDFESGAVVHLQAGETFSATLTPARREYFPVRIPVLDPPQGGAMTVDVEPQAHHGPGYSLAFNMRDSAIEGSLPNGSYTIEVTSYDAGHGAGTFNFSVDGAPVRGSGITIIPNGRINARLRDERNKADNNPAQTMQNLASQIGIRLAPAGEFTFGNDNWLQPSPEVEEGLMSFGIVPPGSYRLRATCNPLGYVATLNSGGRDLLKQPLVVGLGAVLPPLEITIRDDGAELQGSIDGWPSPNHKVNAMNTSLSEPTVVLLPLPDSTGQFCFTPANPSGEFSFPQVPPGDYRVVAFDRLPDDIEYESPAAMEKLAALGLAVRLVAGQKEQMRLTLTPRNQ